MAHLKKSGRSAEYLTSSKNYLAAWAEALAGKDLRTLQGQELKKTLASFETAQKYRTIVFNSFCSWLVERGDLAPEQNPGRYLKVASARRKHEEKGYALEVIEKLYALLPTQAQRDTLAVLAKTGMHQTELDRVLAGIGAIKAVKDQGEIAGTITVKHKTGKLHVISVDAQVLAALNRLQERGASVHRHSTREAVQIICRDNPKFPAVEFGALRHSFATWLLERGTLYSPKGGGLPVEVVATALGHESARTTKLHYVSASLPPMYVVPLRLKHAEDSRSLSAGVAAASG